MLRKQQAPAFLNTTSAFSTPASWRCCWQVQLKRPTHLSGQQRGTAVSLTRKGEEGKRGREGEGKRGREVNKEEGEKEERYG